VAGLRAVILREADAVAEALIVHVGCCGLRQHALLLLSLAEWSEAEFLRSWASGAGDVQG
jgi:hypothetical protein